MSKIIFNEFQRKQLENNPNIDHVSDRSISYKATFKIKAVKENLKGKGPMDIFIDHGFNINIIGSEKPAQCLKRWRQSYKKFGEEGFLTERRGKGVPGRPSSKEMTMEEKLKKAEARIAFLEMENDFLKKLEELERQAKKNKD
jgi:transposase-like protein